MLRSQLRTWLHVSILIFSAAALSTQARSASLPEIQALLSSEGYAVEALDGGTALVIRSPGRIAFLDSQKGGSGEIISFGLNSLVEDARSRMSPKLVNQINEEAFYIKLYLDSEGDGILERYALNLDETGASVAIEIMVSLKEIDTILSKLSFTSYSDPEKALKKLRSGD